MGESPVQPYKSGAEALGEQHTLIGDSLDIWRAITHQTFGEADVMFFLYRQSRPFAKPTG
jgi:hypothetical protein